jgi:hypothetical protein
MTTYIRLSFTYSISQKWVGTKSPGIADSNWRYCTSHGQKVNYGGLTVVLSQPLPAGLKQTHYIHAIAQAVSRWLPTAAARVWSCGILWWTKWRWGGFSPSTSVSPANLHSTNCSTITLIYHLGLVYWARSGRSTKGLSPPPPPKNPRHAITRPAIRTKHLMNKSGPSLLEPAHLFRGRF